ncbi:MAG: hypothetical protein HY866_08375 [Chloroflexi bacterium]|nr:hypothetical protein [Chloroflexota bacterium]
MSMALDPNEIEGLDEIVETGRPSRMVFWLIIMGLAGLFLPLYLLSTAIKEHNQTLKNDLAQIEQQESELSQPGSEQQTLQDELIKARQRLDLLSTVQTDLIAQHINWPAVMAVVGNNGYVQMELLSLSQANELIMLHGQAQAESVVMAYARMLEESDQFSRVIVQSISLKILPTPTPPPTTEPTVTTTLTSPETTPPPVDPEQVVEFVILVEFNPQGGGNE